MKDEDQYNDAMEELEEESNRWRKQQNIKLLAALDDLTEREEIEGREREKEKERQRGREMDSKENEDANVTPMVNFPPQ